MPLRAHHGKHCAREVVPAKDIRLEHRAQRVGWQIFDCTGAGKGAGVKKRIQRAAGFG